MVKEKMPSFIATHLDPANRFIEVVCGLIMVLNMPTKSPGLNL